MNAIKETVSALSAVVIVLGAFSTLVPSKAYIKPIRFLFAAIILLTAVSCFSIDIKLEDFKIHNVGSSYAYYDTDQALLTATEDNLVKSIGDILKGIEIEFNEISVNMNITEGRRISINGINIFLDKAQSGRRQEIRNTVKEKTGVYPTLIFV